MQIRCNLIVISLSCSLLSHIFAITLVDDYVNKVTLTKIYFKIIGLLILRVTIYNI